MNALQAAIIFSRNAVKQAKAYADKAKADKAANPTAGHVAVLDAEGNLVDGGATPLKVTVQQTTAKFE